MARSPISVAPVRRMAIEQEIFNPHRLATLADIEYNTAVRWWNDEIDLLRFDAIVLFKLAKLLKCNEPGELLIYRRDHETD